MKGIKDFFRKLSRHARRFMDGRYGMDKLNSALLWTSLGVAFLGMLLPFAVIRLLLTAVAYLMIIYVMYRSFSRQTYKRYQENRKFLLLRDRLKDWKNRYYQ